jgi:hypothetical protein
MQQHVLFKGILIIFLMVFIGCMSQHPLNKTDIIAFKPIPTRAEGYTISVPIKYEFSIAGGHDMATSVFRYGKALLYISLDMTMNWENLPLKKEDSIHNDILYNKPFFYCDTVIYSGKEKSRYWKEYRIYRKVEKDARFMMPAVEILNIGYRYVSHKNKALFDSCLLSVQPLENVSMEIDSLRIDALRRQDEFYASKKYRRIQKRYIRKTHE